jgi:hypothetical protein
MIDTLLQCTRGIFGVRQEAAGFETHVRRKTVLKNKKYISLNFISRSPLLLSPPSLSFLLSLSLFRFPENF